MFTFVETSWLNGGDRVESANSLARKPCTTQKNKSTCVIEPHKFLSCYQLGGNWSIWLIFIIISRIITIHKDGWKI